MNQGFVQICR